MSANTSIEWCDHTFNPWIGCTKISPACDNCYAARQDAFRHWTPEGWGGPRKRTKTWGDPVKWNGQSFVECMACRWRGPASKAGLKDCPPGFDRDPGVMKTCPECQEPLLKETRARVFCASLADVFDNEVDPEWRCDLMRLIASTQNLDWLLLTKRIGNARAMLDAAAASFGMTWGPHWRNVLLGATIANQEEADRDIQKLLATPAHVRFLSIEPMLGPVDVSPWLTAAPIEPNGSGTLTRKIDWVIVGGESGPKARPLHVEWVRSIVDQCKAAGIPVLVKQLGHVVLDEGMSSPGQHWPIDMVREPLARTHESDPPFVVRLNDKKGGDVAEWPEDLRIREFPAQVEHNRFAEVTP